MDDLTMKQITAMLQERRQRDAYLYEISYITGKPVAELKAERDGRTYKPPRSRQDKIENIMHKRYGVPQELIDALIAELDYDRWD